MTRNESNEDKQKGSDINALPQQKYREYWNDMPKKKDSEKSVSSEDSTQVENLKEQSTESLDGTTTVEIEPIQGLPPSVFEAPKFTYFTLNKDQASLCIEALDEHFTARVQREGRGAEPLKQMADKLVSELKKYAGES